MGKHHSRVRRAFVAGSTALCVVACSASANDAIVFEHVRLSPDGRLVAFHFYKGPLDTPNRRNLDKHQPRDLGLYEWQSGKLTRIPSPPDKQLGQPSFSHDGKRLAVTISNRKALVWQNIAVVDLDSMSVTQVTRSETSLLV